MEDSDLIEELKRKVEEAEELLRRRKEALAALRGKANSGKRGTRGLRPGSIPAIAQGALKGRQALTLEELTAAVKKVKPDVDSRGVSIALSKYVRKGQHFVINEDGRYAAK